MATTLGSKSVGSVVKVEEDGVLQEYIIVHQGLPSSMYDSSCDGTWLLRKDLITTRSWSAVGDLNVYETSGLDFWLNTTMLNKFTPAVQSAIKQAKFPYRKGGKNGTNMTGANGLSRKIILLSDCEVGAINNSSASYVPSIGSKLDYLPSGNENNQLRVAKYLESTYMWHLRAPTLLYESHTVCVDSGGRITLCNTSNSIGIRPAFILPSSVILDSYSSIQINAPSTPGSINVPSIIDVMKFTSISWGTSYDIDNNLDGYILERELDKTGSWIQVYKGSNTSYSDAITKNSTLVRYRVKAYDSIGVESDYKTSEVCQINNPPSTPASITPPSKIRGGEPCEISWGASIDVESNLAGYILERQWDESGDWSQIYKGPNLTYTDTIPKGEHTKVAYRVKAYDERNLESGYKTSSAITINNNDLPTISGNSHDLGSFELDPPSPWTYTVNDVDEANTLTVTESLDGVMKRQYNPTRGEENTLSWTADEWQKITNGQHTATITVSDGYEEATWELNFVKKVHKAVVTMKQPIESETQITLCALSVSGEIPGDATYTVEVTNNGKDDEPTWEDMTADIKVGRNHVFTSQTQTNGWAFNFRITAERGQDGESEADGYIIAVQGGFQ